MNRHLAINPKKNIFFKNDKKWIYILNGRLLIILGSKNIHILEKI